MGVVEGTNLRSFNFLIDSDAAVRSTDSSQL